MADSHKYRLVRPHSYLAAQLPANYPNSVNAAIARYLRLVARPPQFSEAEWNLLRNACNGWATQHEPSVRFAQALALQVEKYLAEQNIEAPGLVARLYSLSELDAIATIHAIELFWYPSR